MGIYVKKGDISNVEILVGEGVVSLKDSIYSFFKGGFISVLYDVNLKDYGEELAREICDSEHRTLSTCLVSEIPDYTRLIVAVGTGSIAYEARRKATELGIDVILVFSAPTTDTILTKWKNLAFFNKVYLDKSLLLACPKECVASGWGIVLAEPLRYFEKYYAEKVLDEIDNIELFEPLSSNANNVDLAYRLLEMSQHNFVDDNATIMAKVLYDSARRQGIKRRLIGEYKFVSAAVIASAYESYLSSPSIDCLLPPAHDLNLDKLCKLTGRPMEKLLKAFDIFDVDSYFKVGYILSEYRLDLLDKLKGVDFRSSQKRWRRLYADAGYWLKSTFTSHSLIEAMKLSAEIGRGLLRYMAESGLADAC